MTKDVYVMAHMCSIQNRNIVFHYKLCNKTALDLRYPEAAWRRVNLWCLISRANIISGM